MNKDQLMGGGASASPWGGGGYGGSSAVGPSTSWKPPSEEESLEQLQKRIDDHDSAIKDSLHRTTAMANQTREVGAATLRDIHMQGEQLKGIAANQQKARARAARSLHAAGRRDVSPPLPPSLSPLRSRRTCRPRTSFCGAWSRGGAPLSTGQPLGGGVEGEGRSHWERGGDRRVGHGDQQGDQEDRGAPRPARGGQERGGSLALHHGCPHLGCSRRPHGLTGTCAPRPFPQAQRAAESAVAPTHLASRAPPPRASHPPPLPLQAQLEAAGGSGWRREQVYGGGSAAPVTDECDALSQISSIVGDLKLQADAMNKELKLQSGQLDAIDSKADRNASQLEATNMRTKKLSRR